MWFSKRSFLVFLHTGALESTLISFSTSICFSFQSDKFVLLLFLFSCFFLFFKIKPVSRLPANFGRRPLPGRCVPVSVARTRHSLGDQGYFRKRAWSSGLDSEGSISLAPPQREIGTGKTENPTKIVNESPIASPARSESAHPKSDGRSKTEATRLPMSRRD